MNGKGLNILFVFFHFYFWLFIWNVLVDAQSDDTPCKYGDCEHGGTCINGTCICKNNGWTGDRCQLCSGRFRLTEEEGELHDGIGNYSVNIKCSWILDINSSKPIKLSFVQFSTECGWDHLHVFDGPSVYSPLVGSFSGISNNVKDVVLQSGNGFLYFFSDVAYNMGGFNLTYKVVHCPSDCSGNGRCVKETKQCVCDAGWTGVDCSTVVGCLNDCSGQGLCVNDSCECNSAYTGEDCSVPVQGISWQTVKSMSAPVGRASAGADVLGGHLYVSGGETLLNRFAVHTNDSAGFYRYNILSRTWQRLNDSGLLGDRFAHTLSADESQNKLYCYGGTVDGVPTDHLAVYDTLTEDWQTLSSGLHAVSGHTAHVIGRFLYVLFGQSPINGFHHLQQVYHITNDSWTIVPTHGVRVRGRYGHSSVYDVRSNSVFVYGGYHDNYRLGSHRISSYAYRLLIDSMTWVGLTPAPHINYLHSAVLVHGYMLVAAGNMHNDTSTSPDSQCYSSTLMAYDLCCDRWIEMSAIDLSIQGINRYGHKMFTYDGVPYIYGGFNGLMLTDVVKLNTPNCTQYTTEGECMTSFYSQNITHVFSPCMWDGLGCVEREGRCENDTCSRSLAEDQQKCRQFTDCVSCLSTDGCAYESSFSSKCIAEATSKIEDTQTDLCTDLGCSAQRDCRLCNQVDGCSWLFSYNRCLSTSSLSGKELLSIADSECSQPCHTHNSCSNCTSSSCLWCESQSTCIDSNSYLTYFPYGQCLEWTTASSKCQDVSCHNTSSCSMCLNNAMCGWCNDDSNTGKGKCTRGGLYADLNSTCSASNWHFARCPACQCNGHSACDSLNKCIWCEGNTTGDNCELCAPGYYGDAVNGGTCRRCDCDGVADLCDQKTGSCHCKVQGTVGDKCDSCDKMRDYLPDTLHNKECYYGLIVDFKYTFNFSKQTDKYVTRINLQCLPKYQDRDILFTITCRGDAVTNLTLYSAAYPGNFRHIRKISCPQQTNELTIHHDEYNFNSSNNSTLLLTVDSFSTPFVFQVSFTQHSRINLLIFLLIFFGCFVALMTMAGLIWKVRGRYLLIQRRNQERQERRIMASRPFSSILVSVDDLKGVSREQPASTPAVESREPTSAFQRTFSWRNRRKPAAHQNMASAVGVEPLDKRPAAVVSVLVKLPTGGQEVAGLGCSGLAFGTVLLSSGPTSSTNSSSKVAYKQGKVIFKSHSVFHPV